MFLVFFTSEHLPFTARLIYTETLDIAFIHQCDEYRTTILSAKSYIGSAFPGGGDFLQDLTLRRDLCDHALTKTCDIDIPLDIAAHTVHGEVGELDQHFSVADLSVIQAVCPDKFAAIDVEGVFVGA